MAFDANGNYVYEAFGPNNTAFQPIPNSVETGGNYGVAAGGVPLGINDPNAGPVPGGGGETPGGFNPYIQGINAFSGVANAYLGFKALQLGRDQFKFSKDSFNKNLANQAQTINTQLEDTQRARLSATGEYDRNTAQGQAALQQQLETYTAANSVSGAPV